MTSVTAWNSTEGLPKQFLSSLRILFDILDEKRCGYVSLQDIETRWHEEGVKGLPSGVTDALRKVAPQNGYLSFERFVSGLKLALLTSKSKISSHPITEKENISNDTVASVKTTTKQRLGSSQNDDSSRNLKKRLPSNSEISKDQNQRQRFGNSDTSSKDPRQRLPSNSDTSSKDRRQRLPSNSDVTNAKDSTQRRVTQNLYNSTNQRSHNINPTATVLPNNVHGQTWRNAQAQNQDTKYESATRDVHQVQSAPPPRPERHSPSHKPEHQLPPKIPPRGDTSKHIINELKNWQRRIHRNPQEKSNSDSKLTDKDDIYVNIAQLNVSDHGPGNSSQPKSATVKRRDSARRHTLSSGVDTNMIKRAKQLEEEKQILLQGLAMTDQARLWYLKQIGLTEEKQKYASKHSHSDYNLEAMQERINFEKARVAEVNHQLKTLVDSSEKGFPLHMNLAMTSSSQQFEKTIRLIKEQNRQLTKEIGQKSDKITQLEQEKASLIRNLLMARTQNKSDYDDTTFM